MLKQSMAALMAFLLLVSFAGDALAGDPIPGVDVKLGRNPGGIHQPLLTRFDGLGALLRHWLEERPQVAPLRVRFGHTYRCASQIAA